MATYALNKDAFRAPCSRSSLLQADPAINHTSRTLGDITDDNSNRAHAVHIHIVDMTSKPSPSPRHSKALD